MKNVGRIVAEQSAEEFQKNYPTDALPGDFFENAAEAGQKFFFVDPWRMVLDMDSFITDLEVQQCDRRVQVVADRVRSIRKSLKRLWGESAKVN